MQLFGPSAVPNTAQAIAQATSSTGSTSPTSNSANSPSSLTSEQTFLQLLIAQIQNQDPLNPTDSIQFVGQLVQYSELEQLMGINQGVQNLAGSSTSTSSTNGTSGNSTNKTSSS
jgi:flagellar basal-body rod modification protein FlgD